MEMLALTFDRSREDWGSSTGLVKERVPVPTLVDPDDGADRSQCIVKVRYAGFCGSDRSIWHRRAFGQMILRGLDEEGRDKRVTGHELLGEIVEMGSRVAGKYGLRPGQVVSAESHIVCGTCYQCRLGENHVCARDRIVGFSQDGCFAEYVKLPAKNLWPTDLDLVRPEVGAIQEPFGNAVHACQVADLRGRNVVVLGCGAIGLFAVLVARGMGASTVIGVEVDPHHAELARRLGCDEVLQPARTEPSWASDPALRERVYAMTGGVGADVAMEMAGHNGALNNALRCVRRGGHVVAFGVRSGDAVLQDAHRIVMDGIQVHGVVGRRIFATWEITRNLLENRSNGIQDAIWEVILNRGKGTVADIRGWERPSFEAAMEAHPKLLIRFS